MRRDEEGDDFEYFTVSMHPDDFYNGDYYPDGNWNGYPHFSSDAGAHLYYLNNDAHPDGYWQLDNRE